ncbi:MAG: hypothetical protein IKU37_10015 [Candidatus Gastranaerophilales bacterium]|nr:hypothetical protein [Candidatus Gastranaerophilales bacterium]
MKKLFVSIFLSFLLIYPTNAVDMLDVDYNFIDTAFDGIQPITDKQFNDTINKLTPQPVDNSFGGKLKTFLFGRKYGVEPQPKGQDKEIDIGGEQKAIQDLKNGVQYIKLIATIIGENNQIIQAGNYKIQEKIINGQTMLVFYQGHNEYGMLKLIKFEDTLKKENDLIYSRVDIVSDDTIRIVYSTLSDTKCAIAKVY